MQAFTGFYRLRVPRLRGVNGGAAGYWCGNGCGTETETALRQLHDNDLMGQEWVKAGIEAAKSPTRIVDL